MTPLEVYPNKGTYSLIIYDLRAPESPASLHRERAIWRDRSEIEALDANHFILIVQPATGSEVSL